MFKNIKKSYIVGLIIVIILFVIVFIILKNSNTQEVKNLIINGNYKDALTLIIEKNVSKEKICLFIDSNKAQYDNLSIDDFINFTEQDWNKLKEYNELLNYIGYNDSQISNYVELEKYFESFYAYKWYSSPDYYKWELVRNGMNENIDNSIAILKEYSFDIYGNDKKYLCDLEKERKNLIKDLVNLNVAKNTNDQNALDIAKTNVLKTLNRMAGLEIDLVYDCDIIEQLLK